MDEELAKAFADARKEQIIWESMNIEQQNIVYAALEQRNYYKEQAEYWEEQYEWLLREIGGVSPG